MAQYNGPVTVDISSYDAFRNEVLGNGYNVDYVFGDQCVDMAKLLAYNAGRTSPYWKSQPDGYAYEGWTNQASREYNAADYFTLVYNKADVRRGDLVVLDHGRYTGDTTGHIAFADSDWNAATTYAYLLGQNQVNPDPDVGHPNTVTNMSVAKFLGAFRFTAWQQPTPTTRRRGKFPWVLYARKLREKQNI